MSSTRKAAPRPRSNSPDTAAEAAEAVAAEGVEAAEAAEAVAVEAAEAAEAAVRSGGAALACRADAPEGHDRVLAGSATRQAGCRARTSESRQLPFAFISLADHVWLCRFGMTVERVAHLIEKR
jgi:hypothetical protein